MESFNKGDLVLAANATESVWKVLKVRKLGGIANFKCVRINYPRKGDVENFPSEELIPFDEEMPSYRGIRLASTILGLLLGIGCVGQTWANMGGHMDQFPGVFAIWALVPPAWLIAEHAWIFPSLGNPRNKDVFRHGQGLAMFFWAVVATLMIVLFAADAVEHQRLPEPVVETPIRSEPAPIETRAPLPREIPRPLPLGR